MQEQPFQLKNIYSPALLEQAARDIRQVHASFDEKGFLATVFNDQWRNLELKARMRHIANSLRHHLPADYPAALSVLTEVVQRKLDQNGEKMAFEWGFLPDFIEAHGVAHPNHSIPAMAVMTRLTSAEFAVRPFLLQYPERMYAQMHAWATHDSAMVRRLSSEGIRPRLPWGMGVPALKRDPSPILPILEQLKNDPAETVRRSVANNLNDISKDHSELALRLAVQWKGSSPETDWVVRHACRGLLKKGHPEALRLFGFDSSQASCTVSDLKCTPLVRIGERLYFSFSLRNEQDIPENIRLEYAITYQTLSGKPSRKVFKISEQTLSPNATIRVEKNQRFQDFTTRKHYPGGHRLAILVNGQEMQAVDFEVVLA
jgi:3-methyladenine DNA glycosylase AlkC